jgi:hypothetical protein
MADQYVERVENLIRVVGSARDEDFNLSLWCNCAIGHAVKDEYFIALGFDPIRDVDPGQSLVLVIGRFFDISAARAKSLFIPSTDGKYDTRRDVLAALRVLLLEKIAQQDVLAALRVLVLEKIAQQQIDVSAKPGWSTPHIEELADTVA